VTVYIYIWTSP